MTGYFENVSVRRAKPADANAIASVHFLSWRYEYAGLLPESVIRSQSLPDITVFWRDFVSEPNNWPVFVLEEDRHVVGFSSVIPARDDDVDELKVSELAAIYLKESSRDKGLGASLLQSCLDESCARGCMSMVLWVLDGNRQALGFYRKHGFVVDGDSRCEEPFAVHETRMRVDITGNASLSDSMQTHDE
ncbi:GNAT family N-acetyltransferase [Granulosicoccus antarcticus]|uniref:L-amino acid N-acyltransferase MnaT n=1 Tax=Granulosicoccus antarcticus IMCC3135 TaxID=1192854 RepID=A0A2Z2NST8_9GAMM|nr:GNAT family N-acetyltransferase [Granulosicoccus antarcticus]ASJ73091.1 L-amino acid N-acyltransferase MnaT [Granulosicoccus antarcticus IMCC3135]